MKFFISHDETAKLVHSVNKLSSCKRFKHQNALNILKISDIDILQRIENLLDQESYSIILQVIFKVTDLYLQQMFSI